MWELPLLNKETIQILFEKLLLKKDATNIYIIKNLYFIYTKFII
ncbi:hypothetical protein LEP1GSC073_3260 [Leptospira noguchii str. Cascata]|nr:hypothetical protein LEP1GSC073_3260 [Leptospira noguchii str. Cascata]